MTDEEKNENKSNIDTSAKEFKGSGFFKKVWYSIVKFEKYPEMSAEGVPSALRYLAKIMAIFAVIISIAITIQLYQTVQSGIKYIENDLPNFSYKDGILTVDSNEAITIDKVKVVGKVIIDTITENEETVNQYKNRITNEEYGIIILKDKMIIKNIVSSGEVTYNYKEILSSSGSNITEFTKQDIINFTNGKEMTSLYFSFFVVIFIYAFIMYIASTLMDTLILSALGYLTALIAKIKMKFAAIYNMSVYALTLSIILNALYIVVNMFTGFKITYFQVMYTSVAYIYLAAAIFIIKSEFIKKQAELIKIIEEQEKQKDEYKEETKPNREPKEKNKENEDDKEENNDNKGEEPEGSNA